MVDPENALKETGLNIHSDPIVKGEIQRLRTRNTGGIGNKVGTCSE